MGCLQTPGCIFKPVAYSFTNMPSFCNRILSPSSLAASKSAAELSSAQRMVYKQMRIRESSSQTCQICSKLVCQSKHMLNATAILLTSYSPVLPLPTKLGNQSTNHATPRGKDPEGLPTIVPGSTGFSHIQFMFQTPGLQPATCVESQKGTPGRHLYEALCQ